MANPSLRSLAKQDPSVLAGSRAPSTCKGYLSYFQKWKSWASLFPECKYFPADETHVALFLHNLMQSRYSFSSITSAFYAISFSIIRVVSRSFIEAFSAFLRYDEICNIRWCNVVIEDQYFPPYRARPISITKVALD